MQKTALLVATLLLSCLQLKAQLFDKPIFSGVYLQWGYGRDKFSKSDLHFHNGSKYDFTVHQAVARDQPDFTGFWTNPLDITIPQNSFRIGVFLNAKHTHAIEVNYDHAKYVIKDGQRARMTGTIGDQVFDKDTTIGAPFLHFEHTNGANFYLINYVGQQELWKNKKRTLATVVYKLGAGTMIPRSDVTIMGKRLDNTFHVAGYMFGTEAGLRIYPFRNLFFEATVKGGFANYLSVLTIGDGRARHHFWYGEVLGFIGYDINFKKKKAAQP